MDNYGSSQHPYGYPNPYLSPGNTPPYPPPPDPYAPTPYAYPPNHQHSFNYSYPPPPPPHSSAPYSSHMDYSYPPPPPPPHSSAPYSGHIDYSYPPPPPPTTSSAGSYDFHWPQPPHTYPYPHQAPPEWSVTAGGVSQTSDSFNPPHSSAYPPLDDLMSNVRLSDNNQPSAPPLTHSVSIPNQEKRNEFYGYPSHSSSSLDQGDPSRLSASSDDSVHSQSLQIVPAQHKGSLRVLLLHGNLDIWVHGAKKPSKHGHVPQDFGGYVWEIACENPVWEQHFNVPVAHHAAEVHFVVKDSDVVGSQLIGIVAIPVEQIYSGEKVQGTYPILNSNGKPCKPGAVLRVSIQYIPMERLIMYHQGVGAGPDYIGVPSTYFPLRKGGTVTLYQDAHVPDGCLPNIVLDHGMYYAHGKCWHDIFDAIRQAQRLVYITGWSVWHKVRLVRDAGHASNFTLGDLLRTKSQEGVRVLLLVWDDPTSRSILGYKMDGVMATHDEETRRFFKHSSVQVLLCPRIAGKRNSWAKQKEVGTIYTHHQKTVIVDADAGNNKRKIVAFVGGLDLCDGRYDTPHHPLFRTLQTLHKDDYHNPTFTGNTGGCPREPWHDLHSKIDGPAAYDVLKNFEERWLRAAKPNGIKKLKSSDDDALLKLDRIRDIIDASNAPSIGDDNPEAWHVQIFRSIDSNSVKGFPKDPKDASSKNLVCGKNVLIDMSIHTAYVKAIRAAQHYIYIENQYFIGSSYNWSQHKDLGANNLIPMEIALKIAAKIRANERFAVYIVIPMWPEGVPTGAATQRILFWQHKTMQMMYETIYKALVEVGLEAAFSPQDYLNFFCLGNREAVDMYENITVTGTPPPANSPQAISRNNRRFMIYVHSKGMIVDDEYVILGSANINQRSMEGTRDTEIAMGAYQPHHTWARRQSYPRGQIHGYRMSLWAEHTGTIEDFFLQPESLECVRRVRTMGELNWKQFSANDVTEMRGHLLKYPVEVDRKGKVRSLPGQEEFPDVGGKIVGSFIAIQENLTI
ncbi:Phospholipase D beta 1 [Spatholobus suberectus]|nr:Phospholipase D beta 1 [Spatholobus suberectus]